MDEELSEAIRLIDAAMVPLPTGTFLYHSTYKPLAYDPVWWFPTSRTEQGCRSVIRDYPPEEEPTVYRIEIRGTVRAVWAGNLKSEYDKEEEILLQSNLPDDAWDRQPLRH